VHAHTCAGDDNKDEALTPSTIHNSLEHQAKLRAMATSTTKLLEETAGYMAGVRAQVGALRPCAPCAQAVPCPHPYTWPCTGRHS